MRSSVLVGGMDPEELFLKAAARTEQARRQDGEFRQEEEVLRRRDLESALRQADAAGWGFQMVESSEFFILKRVPLRGSVYDVMWEKQLLLGGEKHDAAFWSDYTIKSVGTSLKPGRAACYPVSAPIYFGIMDFILKNRVPGSPSDQPISSFERIVGGILRETQVFTRTSVDHRVDNKDDLVSHTYFDGVFFHHSTDPLSFTGPGYIGCGLDGPPPIRERDEVCRSLVGIDAGAVQSIAGWLAGKTAYLLGFTKKPAESFESPFSFGGSAGGPITSNKLFLNPYGASNLPAIGVRLEVSRDISVAGGNP